MSIDFDFDGAARSRCVIRGEREFSLVIGPEHAPPINPSPWYAFHYRALPGGPVSVQLDYLGARHRYDPKQTVAGKSKPLAAEVAPGGKSVTIQLPPGEAIVSGQELFGEARYEALLGRLLKLKASTRIELGRSLDGRPITAVHLGNPAAPRLIILLGRQHPPEVTGALAMETFLDQLAAEIAGGRLDIHRFQILVVPLLNPDGVRRGHWRANHGGVDLNRDWAALSQPETRSVYEWLSSQPKNVRPIAMVDFHSTTRNLFYVQGEGEASSQDELFLGRWLKGQEQVTPGYSFTIERANANKGLGTAKNWFHDTYAIPAYTYEVGDRTDRKAIAVAARNLARRFVIAIDGKQP